MGRKTILIATIIFVTQVGAAAADVNEPNDNNGIQPQAAEAPVVVKKPARKLDTVTIAEFYMRDGTPVTGKLLSDDRNQIVIEQPLESTVAVKTFSKREVDTRTLKTRLAPEWQYYTQLGDYFAARTWDFKDDPDDFIAAIRSYEKAKQSLQDGAADSQKISEVDAMIQKTEKDREVWTREVESRTKLKKLEFDAEAENRLKKIEKQLAESSAKLTESIKYFDKTAADVKDGQQKLEQTFTGFNKNFAGQIQNLQAQINQERALMNETLLWTGHVPVNR
ncbi:MAG: hypothetical protein ABSB91_03180 [Sedimentisphaerales bacterium]